MLTSNTTINKKGIEGFSMLELIMVLAIVMIMTGVAVFYLNAHQDLYEADDQALQIIDILQEGRQRSLTQRETIRVEVDVTANMIRLIDENSPSTANDDILIRETVLANKEKVKVENRPSDINYNPAEDFPVPSAQFKTSIYPTSENNEVCTIRFLSNGTIVDAGTTVTGSGASSQGVTLHIWSPATENDEASRVARAITIIGSTGSMRLWEFNPQLEGDNKWQDSRRTSVYGGTSGDSGGGGEGYTSD